jgi:hypothetical protein
MTRCDFLKILGGSLACLALPIGWLFRSKKPLPREQDPVHGMPHDFSKAAIRYAEAVYVRGRFKNPEVPNELTNEEAELIRRVVCLGVHLRIKERLYNQGAKRDPGDSLLPYFPHFMAEAEKHKKDFEAFKQLPRVRISDSLLDDCFLIGCNAAAIGEIGVAHVRHLESYYGIVPY